MKVVGFCGYSGSGKTTMLEAVIGAFSRAGLRVGVVKHTHKDSFDIDLPGKDSWRHRQAGAVEVVVGNGRRIARITEYQPVRRIDAHTLLGELRDCEWAFVEGFKHDDLPKIEVWRSDLGQPPMYPSDEHIVAIVTNDPGGLPVAPHVPVFSWNDAAALVEFLLGTSAHYRYNGQRDD